MNRFSEKYFEREERSEYLVGETIKRVWASQIVILQEIIKICENNNDFKLLYDTNLRIFDKIETVCKKIYH